MNENATIVPEDEPSGGRHRPGCPVVGIGASAGGIEALQKFLPAVPDPPDMAFVVILHLAPDHDSALAQVLSRAGRLPVSVAANGAAIAPNHVYVIPPHAVLTIENGRLHLAEPVQSRVFRNSVDTFLVSLARDQGENAACVILSGTGNDGTVGLRAIKESGGLTLAQAQAEYDGMMRSALATGLVDLVLPVEAMPAKLVGHFRHRDDLAARKGPDGITRETADYLMQICAVLRTRTGHEFSGYKERTLIRRVQRRMEVLQIDAVPEFLDRLRRDPREVDLLFHDLLIGVTSFFRDPESFEALEKQVIPRLFEGKGADDTVRVWVPGCATGEEAYSIAILLREYMPQSCAAPKLQIFASDIDEHALDVARTGRYPASVARDVPAARLKQYFVREDGTYRVGSELRGICLFASHNLLRDAPFSRLDLISCRNLMIYLGNELQSRVIPLFHYALRDGGCLFLGASENVTRHPRLFAVVDRMHHIFQRRPQAERRLPEFPLIAPDPTQRWREPAWRPPASEVSLQGLAERQLLERYAPAYVVVNADGELLYASSRTGRYLELPPGAPSTNLFSMARRGLRLDLRAAVHQAVSRGEAVIRRNVSVDSNGGHLKLDLSIQPLRHSEVRDTVYMVVFQDFGVIEPNAEPAQGDGAEEMQNATLRQIETELRFTRERLQTTTEELESANEELTSRNEELSSMNEELQSANEELETSKEELQSINEELQTLNAELRARIDELTRANSDIANLLESTRIATVFLGRDLRVKSFTPEAKDLFHLVESDAGRPIAHVRMRFMPDTVEADAERVLRSLTTIERQIESDNGARYVMRMMPYRTIDNVIAGVVVTFSDVTQIAAAEARVGELARDLRNRVESLETLLDLVPVGIFIVESAAVREVQVNRYGLHLLGEEEGGKGLRQRSLRLRLMVDNERELAPEEQPLQRAVHNGAPVPDFEGRLLRADGTSLHVMMSATPLFDEHGRPRGAIAAIVDISQRKMAEAAQDTLLHELQHRVKNILATVGSLAARMLKTGGSKEEFTTAFLARLQAMGDLHDLLSRRNWQGADLRALLTAALAPYATPGMGNIALDGPEIVLKPGAAASLGLVVHELATNAAKYGALSAPGGRIDISWRVAGPAGAARLSLAWVEQDGPRVAATDAEGFGLGFVKRSIEYELEGTVEVTFDPAGLRCTIGFPLRDVAAQETGADGGGEE
ncbi:MAG TPA: CheR family methyltransferase [Stellaceae bacterium]|nr:CheR family methyltransferase [Stellaceae bacterium]